MDQIDVSVTTSKSTPRWRRFRRRLLLAVFAVLVALVIDIAPIVPAKPAPTAEQAQRAHETVRHARQQLADGGGFAKIRIDRTELDSLTALASGIAKFGRYDARFENDGLVLRVSRPFGPLWLNLSARIEPSARGFPDTFLHIGDLPLGKTLSRWIIGTIHWAARQRGIRVTPLDDLVRTVSFEPAAVVSRIHFPLGSGFADELTGLRKGMIDPTLTAVLYCQLLAKNRSEPTDDMALIVRRAFAPNKSALSTIEQNRSAFIALAMYTTNVGAGRLAGNAATRVKTCQADHAEPRLAGRADLAKHWSLSAALAVSLGDDVGTAMGEWKELSDSRPGGSGFSFVDLSADRAGLAVARRATDPATATLAATRLRMATGEDILPIQALALSEGLTEADFVKKYSTINSAQFAAAKARIDSVIAQTIGR